MAFGHYMRCILSVASLAGQDNRINRINRIEFGKSAKRKAFYCTGFQGVATSDRRAERSWEDRQDGVAF